MVMNDVYVSPEYELPISSGEYEIKGIIGEGITKYDAETCTFLPTPGVIGIKGWRYPMPDAADIEEYRLRGRQ